MNDERRIDLDPEYPLGQLARAFSTALTHPDEDTRERARGRFERWESVLRGMASGKLRIGSREPVAGFPAWVTPEVVRGGFATGNPAAGGPLTEAERLKANEVGVPPSRRRLFEWFLSEPGLRDLGELLEGLRYRLDVPEEAALLVAACLGRMGDEAGAVALVTELAPFADELRFAPTPRPLPLGDLEIVSRETIGDVATALSKRKENGRVEAMREALTVWAPFEDELLILTLETSADGQVGEQITGEWRERATALVGRYDVLAATHTRCTKHRKPKENLAILRMAVEVLAGGGTLSERQRGSLQHAVDSILAKRGAPGSERHREIRDAQSRVAALPTHLALANLVVSRTAGLPQDEGTHADADLVGPVSAVEAEQCDLPVGAPIPKRIAGVVARAAAGTVEALIERGTVPSAEVLARLVPQIAAQAVASAYGNEALGRLMAEHYLAFRRRRSLLLLNLEHQVTADELPWVRGVAAHKTDKRRTSSDALTALRRLGFLALTGFPGTILPNPLVRELDTLGRESGAPTPFVEELAADIFVGTFSSKFLAAAKIAAEQLHGSLYGRYYGIDYSQVLEMQPDEPAEGIHTRTASAFAALCRERAGNPHEWSVAANGTVIEQAQILTTHNLAALFGPVGLRPSLEPIAEDLARRSLGHARSLVARTRDNPRPLRTIKDAAYAWRQTILYLSLLDQPEQRRFIEQHGREVAALPTYVSERIGPALEGLASVIEVENTCRAGTAGGVRPFLGWSVGRHWMLRDAAEDNAESEK